MGRTYESMMEELEVIEILSTAYDGDEFPGYENIRLSFSQLETIIRNKRSGWLDALRNQKAVYLITDTSNGKMYVGSATAQYGMLLQNGILPDGVGIPVGNLTSQLFANVYGNRLDKFIKHTLHIKYYIRYMDDFIILSPDLNQLKEWEKRIEEFLEEEMKLHINPKSTILYAGNGVDFCGYIHHPTYRKVRKGSVRRLKKDVKHLKAGELDRETFNRKYQSRLGHMGHADTYHVTKAIEYDLLFWEFEQTQSGLLVPA